jgi:hypothetical protein
MNRKQAISFLIENGKKGTTKADAQRALQGLDFSTDPSEEKIYAHAWLFSGPELNKRQRDQAAWKGLLKKESDMRKEEGLDHITKVNKFEENLKLINDLFQKIFKFHAENKKVG